MLPWVGEWNSRKTRSYGFTNEQLSAPLLRAREWNGWSTLLSSAVHSGMGGARACLDVVHFLPTEFPGHVPPQLPDEQDKQTQMLSICCTTQTMKCL